MTDMDQSDWGKPSKKEAFNMRVSSDINNMIKANTEKNGFKNKTQYVVSLIIEDNGKLKKSRNPEKDAKESVQDRQARLSTILGVKAIILPELTFNLYYKRFKAAGDTDFEKYCEEKGWHIDKIQSVPSPRFHLYPIRETQVAYLITTLQNYLMSKNSTVFLKDKPISITVNDLEAYSELLKLKLQTASSSFVREGMIPVAELHQEPERIAPVIQTVPDEPTKELPGEEDEGPNDEDDEERLEDEDFDASKLTE